MERTAASSISPSMQTVYALNATSNCSMSQVLCNQSLDCTVNPARGDAKHFLQVMIATTYVLWRCCGYRCVSGIESRSRPYERGRTIAALKQSGSNVFVFRSAIVPVCAHCPRGRIDGRIRHLCLAVGFRPIDGRARRLDRV